MKKAHHFLVFCLAILLLSCQSKPHYKKRTSLSLERLALIDSLLEASVTAREIPGAVVLVAKDNKVVYKKAFGIKNPETQEVYQTDDIFRIASMTKAITSLGVILLWEKGLIDFDDPIEKYIPEFEGIGLLETFNAKDSTFTVKPIEEKITVRHLLTHTSGMGYDFIDPNPKIKAIYAKAKQAFMPEGVIGFSTDNVTIETTVKQLAKLPLHHLPGEKFTYAVGLDVLGYLIEIVSNKPLDQYFKEAIFDPLEMHDTYFYLPDDKVSRLVPVLTKKENQWVFFEDDRYEINYPVKGAKRFFSGGGGLSSTVNDYYNFLSLFVNEGKFKNRQVLGKMTVDLLFKDQIGQNLKADYFNMGQGLAFGVVRDKEYVKGGLGSVGTGYWGGYFNTGYFVDPEQNLIGIIYKQTQNVSENSTTLFNRLIFSAVVP